MQKTQLTVRACKNCTHCKLELLPEHDPETHMAYCDKGYWEMGDPEEVEADNDGNDCINFEQKP